MYIRCKQGSLDSLKTRLSIKSLVHLDESARHIAPLAYFDAVSHTSLLLFSPNLPIQPYYFIFDETKSRVHFAKL